MQKRISIALIDDEPAFSKRVRSLIRNLGFPVPEIFDSFDSFEARKKDPDLLICDICLQDQVYSFEKLEKAGLQMPVIYLSSFGCYARAAYSQQAIAYVLKQNIEDELPQALAKGEAVLNRQEKIILKTWHDCVEIPVNHLESIQRMDGKLFAGLSTDQKGLELSERSLKECMSHLPSNYFVAASQSALINLYGIRQLNPDRQTALMRSGREIRISRRKWNEVLSAFLSRSGYVS